MPNFASLPNVPMSVPIGSRVRITGRYTFEGKVLSAAADQTYDWETQTWTKVGWDIELEDDCRGYIYHKYRDWPSVVTVLST